MLLRHYLAKGGSRRALGCSEEEAVPVDAVLQQLPEGGRRSPSR